MRNLAYFIFIFLYSHVLWGQDSPYAVEVAAFAQPAPTGQFSTLEGVYEALDVNYIYRYYINAATKEDAQALRTTVIEKGFTNARVIDFAALKENCDNICQYIPPTKTGHEVVPFGASSSEHTDITHLYAIFFDFDKATIRPDAKIQLDKLFAVMKQNTNYHVVILAHTDSRGSADYNNALSMRRALATQKYLTRKGIHRTNIKKEIYGEKKPIALNELPTGEDSEAGRQFNRRVEFRILDETGAVLNIVDQIQMPEDIKKED